LVLRVFMVCTFILEVMALVWIILFKA
jgi:hypothetical protein